MTTMPDKRRYLRQTSFIVAQYAVAEGTFRDIIRNISAGGLFIEADRHIAVGQPISITFPLFNFDNVIQVYGNVVRRDPDGYVVTFDQPIEGLICKDGYFPEIVHELNR